MADTPAPPGVTVLVTDGTRPVGTASDFDPSTPGGWSLRSAQERRARIAAWWQVFDRTCRTEVARAINQGGSMFDNLRHRLLTEADWQEHVIAHGHEEEGDD